MRRTFPLILLLAIALACAGSARSHAAAQSSKHQITSRQAHQIIALVPGHDETLRRYAINRRTGDVWEMTLCTHYDFPELERLQHTYSGRDAIGASELAAQGKQLGCS